MWGNWFSTGYNLYPFTYVCLYDHHVFQHISLQSECLQLSRSRIRYLERILYNFRGLQK
nr:MAG TPA: hypothetical protein [Caudoviricetes sp.]